MSNEQLLAIVLALVGALYAGVIYEIRTLRRAKHRQAQYVQWCCMAIALIAHDLNIKLPDPPKENH